MAHQRAQLRERWPRRLLGRSQHAAACGGWRLGGRPAATTTAITRRGRTISIPRAAPARAWPRRVNGRAMAAPSQAQLAGQPQSLPHRAGGRRRRGHHQSQAATAGWSRHAALALGRTKLSGVFGASGQLDFSGPGQEGLMPSTHPANRRVPAGAARPRRRPLTAGLRQGQVTVRSQRVMPGASDARSSAPAQRAQLPATQPGPGRHAAARPGCSSSAAI